MLPPRRSRSLGLAVALAIAVEFLACAFLHCACAHVHDHPGAAATVAASDADHRCHGTDDHDHPHGCGLHACHHCQAHADQGWSPSGVVTLPAPAATPWMIPDPLREAARRRTAAPSAVEPPGRGLSLRSPPLLI